MPSSCCLQAARLPSPLLTTRASACPACPSWRRSAAHEGRGGRRKVVSEAGSTQRWEREGPLRAQAGSPLQHVTPRAGAIRSPACWGNGADPLVARTPRRGVSGAAGAGAGRAWGDHKGMQRRRQQDLEEDDDEEEEEVSSLQALPLPGHVAEISSSSNPFVKFCVRLRQSSAFRLRQGRVVVAGATPLREVLQLTPPAAPSEASHSPREAPPSSSSPSPSSPSLGLEVLFLLRDSESSAGANRDLLALAQRVVRVSQGVMGRLSGVESAGSDYTVGILGLPRTFLSRSAGADSSGDGGEALRGEAGPALGRGVQAGEGVRSRAAGFPSGDWDQWLPRRPCRVLALDGVQDPGNVGTLVRTALAFSWDAVVLLPGCCDPFNDKALRASRGASFRLPLAATDWTAFQDLVAHFDLAVFAGEPALEETETETETGSNPKSSGSTDLGSVMEADGEIGARHQRGGSGMVVLSPKLGPAQAGGVLSKPLCLILGSEGQGLSRQAVEMATPIGIAMPGNMESLNVAVAGGIFMYILAP